MTYRPVGRYSFTTTSTFNISLGDCGLVMISRSASSGVATVNLIGGGSLGQQVTLMYMGPNTGPADSISIANTGDVWTLSSTWTPGKFDTLTLLWNGTHWVEICRANVVTV